MTADLRHHDAALGRCGYAKAWIIWVKAHEGRAKNRF